MNEMQTPRVIAGVVPAHGGTLKELLSADDAGIQTLRDEAARLPSWELTSRQVCDTELLLNGGFSPLEGFLGREDYGSVCGEMRLVDGTIWPIPITLDVTEAFASSLTKGARVTLRDPEGVALAILTVSDVWRPDLREEARLVYGTTDELHPGVTNLFHHTGTLYVGGRLEGLELPAHSTFGELRHTPAQLRKLFDAKGWKRIVAFQTRNPMHRAHVEVTKQAAREAEANLLIHPVVGQTKPGDVESYTRVRCYQALLQYYPEQTTALSLLPLAMRMAGPREAVWHAIIRKNYGCTHLIVGRDHAGPGNDSQGKPFYSPYAAQELLAMHEQELGIKLVSFEEMVYVESVGQYMVRSQVPDGAEVLSISGTELRSRLEQGTELPEWFTYPEVALELRRLYPARGQ